MQEVISFYNENSVAIFAVLLFASEALALIPGVKANSIFQLVVGWIKKAAAKKSPKNEV